MTQEQKLERWAERELKRNIKKLIISDDDGSYVMFGLYQIVPVSNGFAVNTWSETVHVFGSKRSATSWCVADKLKQYRLADEILLLDRKHQLLGADIHCRRVLAQQGRHESFYEIVNMKIQPKIDVYNVVHSELEKCINQAKYLQIRGFNNETE